MEIEIGRSKRARRVYAFDDIAVVPSRRTRDPEDVSVGWSIDAYQFDIPFLAAPMDSVVSPTTAIMMGQLGGLGVLDLEGLWTRYEDPEPLLKEIRELPANQTTARMQEIYAAPIQPTLVTERLAQIRAAGVTVAAALSPQRTQELYETVVAAGVDLFVIRGTTVSAEHVSRNQEPLNLKKFIYDLDVPVIVGGAATYTAALHLMRTGAAGVLVGFGGGAASTTRTSLGIHAPMATAVADVAGARRDYMDESGGRYVHVIADGGLSTSGDIVKAIACGADAVMLGTALARATDAPGGGFHWGAEAHHSQLPRGKRVQVGTVAPLEAILYGPAPVADGTANLVGALAPLDGHHRIQRNQRISAGRGSCRAVLSELASKHAPPMAMGVCR
jgi:IMP dehydrogenase